MVISTPGSFSKYLYDPLLGDSSWMDPVWTVFPQIILSCLTILWVSTWNNNSHTFLKWVQTGKSLWKTIWQFLVILKMQISYVPAIQHLSEYPQEISDCYTCAKVFITALYIIIPTWNFQIIQIDRLKSINRLYYNGILHNNEEEQILLA